MKKIICISMLILLIAHFENMYFSNRLELYYDAYDDNTQMHSNGKNGYAEGLTEGTYPFTENDKSCIIEIFHDYDIFQYSHIHFYNELEIKTGDYYPWGSSYLRIYIEGYCEQGFDDEIEEFQNNYPGSDFHNVWESQKDDTTKVSLYRYLEFPHSNFILDGEEYKYSLASYEPIALKLAEKIYVEDFKLYQKNMDIKIAEMITRIQYIAIVRYIGIGTLVISTLILIGNIIKKYRKT